MDLAFNTNQDDRLAALEATFISETERLLKFKQVVDRHSKERQHRMSSIVNNQSEAKFYRDKIKMNLDEELAKLKLDATQLALKRDQLKGIMQILDSYDFEPNEDALRARIDELRRNRLSLEILDC